VVGRTAQYEQAACGQDNPGPGDAPAGKAAARSGAAASEQTIVDDFKNDLAACTTWGNGCIGAACLSESFTEGVTTMMSRIRFFGFALFGVATLTSVARADFVGPSYNTPISFGVCGDLDTASEMANPNYFAAHAGPNSTLHGCEALCRAAAAQCKQAAAATGACNLKGLSHALQFERTSCAANNDVALSVKECMSAAHGDIAASKDAIIEHVKGAQADCASWGASCAMDCDQP